MRVQLQLFYLLEEENPVGPGLMEPLRLSPGLNQGSLL